MMGPEMANQPMMSDRDLPRDQDEENFSDDEALASFERRSLPSQESMVSAAVIILSQSYDWFRNNLTFSFKAPPKRPLTRPRGGQAPFRPPRFPMEIFASHHLDAQAHPHHAAPGNHHPHRQPLLHKVSARAERRRLKVCPFPRSTLKDAPSS